MKKALLFILISSFIIHLFAFILVDHSSDKTVRVSTWNMVDYVLSKGSNGYFDVYDPLSNKTVNFFEFTTSCVEQVRSLYYNSTDENGNVTTSQTIYRAVLNTIYNDSIFGHIDDLTSRIFNLKPLYTLLAQLVRMLEVVFILSYFLLFTVYFTAVVLLRFVQLFVELVSTVQFV